MGKRARDSSGPTASGAPAASGADEGPGVEDTEATAMSNRVLQWRRAEARKCAASEADRDRLDDGRHRAAERDVGV